jgi:hypothetical protein
MHAVLGPEVGKLHVEGRDTWQDLVSMTPRSRGMMLAPSVCLWNSQLGSKFMAYGNKALRDVRAQDGAGIPSMKEE